MAKAQPFGQRVRELRLERNLTQRDLANQVAAKLKEEDRRGFDFTYLSKIENGRLPPPSVPAILAIAVILRTDSDELLALAGKAPPDVGKTLKGSPGARAFFRSATNLDLSEEEWKRLLKQLEQKKDEGT